MSRKRQASDSRTPRYSDNTSGGTNEYVYDYYQPGCYLIPEVARNSAPPYFPCYATPRQWSISNPATYVVNDCGLAYYVSDFENHLHLSHLGGADIIYEFFTREEDEQSEDENESEAAVSSCKRPRLDSNGNSSDSSDNIFPTSSNMTNLNGEEQGHVSGRCYRAEEGYIVEEPSDSEPLKGDVSNIYNGNK